MNNIKSWRLAVIDEYGYACAKCGNEENLDIHHILPKSLFPEHRYTINNGIPLCFNCHRDVHLNGYDFSEFLNEELVEKFNEYHKSMFINGKYNGYDIGSYERIRSKERGLDHIKLSFGMFHDTKIKQLKRMQGAAGLGIYIHVLLTMSADVSDSHCSIEINDNYVAEIADEYSIDKFLVRGIINTMIEIKLLRPYNVSQSRYFSKGFLKGTGELLSADYLRSIGDPNAPGFKQKYKVDIIKQPIDSVDNNE